MESRMKMMDSETRKIVLSAVEKLEEYKAKIQYIKKVVDLICCI